LTVLAVFCFGFAASIIYKNTIQKLVKKMAYKLHMRVVRCADGVESVLLKME
jgi:galactitol-specific phosphotransferase system IIB component